ncbi:hypothetical protein [Euzebya pacifica]|uniref:hypothetical protein n=1 Tax=Euzebya pacifica TaxID=1608957 RepID=UPI0013DF6E51|nr:hypothetical protein [Euzebya pacifica]
MSTIRHAVLIVLLLVLAAGCELRLETRVALDDDGGGALEFTLAPDAELVDMAASAGVDPLGRLVERVEALEGWDLSTGEAEDGTLQEVTVRTGFDGPEEFGLRYEELRSALDAPEAQLLGPLSLALDPEADVVSLTGTVPFRLTEVAAADTGVPLETLGQQVDTAVQYTFVVTTPVPLVEGTATATSPVDPEDPDGAQQVVLELSPGQEQALDVAYVRPGLDLFAILLQGGIALLAVLAIGGGVLAQRRRVR